MMIWMQKSLLHNVLQMKYNLMKYKSHTMNRGTFQI